MKLMSMGKCQEWYPSKIVNGDMDSRVCKQREIKNHRELRENVVESLGVIQKNKHFAKETAHFSGKTKQNNKKQTSKQRR